MKRCIYVGHSARTGATVMLTPEGMVRGIGINRLLVEDRHEKEFLKAKRSSRNS